MRACVKKWRALAVTVSSWAVPAPLSIVNEGFVERGNSPTLINLDYNNALIWGGRAPSLTKQAIDSTTNLLRMGQELEKLMPVLKANSKMLSVFQAANGN